MFGTGPREFKRLICSCPVRENKLNLSILFTHT